MNTQTTVQFAVEGGAYSGPWTITMTEFDDASVAVEASLPYTWAPGSWDFELEFDAAPTVAELVAALDEAVDRMNDASLT